MASLLDRVTCLDPRPIRPIHGVKEREFYETLVQSMGQWGWSGRPLLVMPRLRGGYQAITGSHRVAAAKRVGLPRIPVIVLGEEESAVVRSSEEGWDLEQDRPLSTDAIASTLERYGHEVIGGFIRMDIVVSALETRGVLPWSPEAQSFYGSFRWNYPELLEILGIASWRC